MRKVLIISTVGMLAIVALIQKNVIKIQVTQKGDILETTNSIHQEEVLADSDEALQSIALEPTGSKEEEQATPTDTPSVGNDQNIDTYIYSGGQISSQTANSVVYTVDADPNIVTDWMKELINSEGYNVTSFVTTSANENIENKLVAADGTSKVSVNLTQGPDDAFTNVEVLLE